MIDVNLCKGCAYSADFYDTICCDYIGIVRRSRPKSGAGQCTVYKPRTHGIYRRNPLEDVDITYGECEPWRKEEK